MRSKSVKPSHYPPIPFHAIRTISFISSLIVAIILAVFIYKLHQVDHKLPWAFLVLIITSLFSLINILLTTITHCCYGLSPRLSLTFNTILLILWCISLGLLSWSMSRTIQTSCTKTFWGTSTGISVCRSYKGLFAFTAIGTAATIASVWLDIIVRRRETRFGKYGQMTSETALGDVKLEDRNSAYLSAPLPPPPGPGTGVHDDDPWNVPHPVNARDGYPPEYWGGDRDSLDAGHHAAVERDYYGDSDYYYGQQTPAWSQGPRSRLGRREYEYSHLPEQTGYDPAAYR